HDRCKMRGRCFSDRPLLQKYWVDGFVPGTTDIRNRTIDVTNALPDCKPDFATCNTFSKHSIPIRDCNLRESGVAIDKGAPPRKLVLFSPYQYGRRPHDKQVRLAANVTKLTDRHASGVIVGPIDPTFAKTKRFKTRLDERGWVIKAIIPIRLVPIPYKANVSTI